MSLHQEIQKLIKGYSYISCLLLVHPEIDVLDTTIDEILSTYEFTNLDIGMILSEVVPKVRKAVANGAVVIANVEDCSTIKGTVYTPQPNKNLSGFEGKLTLITQEAPLPCLTPMGDSTSNRT